jgi:hypothetical protein
MESDNSDNKQNKPWLFQPGVSGNPAGRPKGSISLKEFARKMLQELPDDEKLEFLKGMPKDVIWKMADGNPANATDLTSKGEKIIIMPAELINKNDK